MHESDDRKRWLDLLDDLGLQPESQAAPPLPVVKAAAVQPAEPIPLAPVAEVPEPEPIPVAEAAPEDAAPAPRTRRKKATAPEAEGEKEPATRTRRKRRVGKAEDAVEEAPPAVEEPAPALAVEPVTVDIPFEPEPHPVAAEAESAPTMAEASEPAGEEPPEADADAPANGEDSAKGARRRRRRRRRKPTDAPEGSAEQPAVAGRAMAEEALEDADDGDEDEASMSADEVVFEKEGPAETPSALEEDADEFEDLTNLDMPSWSELVGSLYRPPDR